MRTYQIVLHSSDDTVLFLDQYFLDHDAVHKWYIWMGYIAIHSLVLCIVGWTETGSITGWTLKLFSFFFLNQVICKYHYFYLWQIRNGLQPTSHWSWSTDVLQRLFTDNSSNLQGSWEEKPCFIHLCNPATFHGAWYRVGIS